jgi:lipopolysaccharide biosynthesis protein
LGAHVALFCHFDPGGAVRADVLHYLRELSAAGFSVVIVSNSGHLQPHAMAALRSVCASVLVRRNSGRDFAAWREALEHLALPRPETKRLLLANDSVHGPLTALVPLLARMDATADVWGMTDSNELGWHLQSYFLLVGEAVLHSAVWRRFWRQVRPMHAKLLAIMWYEIGLSRCLTEAGFRLSALFPYTSVACGAAANPTLAASRTLRQAGFPFVKRALLR